MRRKRRSAVRAPPATISINAKPTALMPPHANQPGQAAGANAQYRQAPVMAAMR
jgi:hypothetical protein